MNFTEYLELNEDLELFDSMDESILSGISGLVKGVGGAATNLGSQIVRGGGNVAGGLARGLYGGTQVGLGALQTLGGGHKKGLENIKKGASTATSGVGQVAKGVAQAVASPATAILRGAQAAGESGAPTLGFAKDRNWAQKTFGLNAWEEKPETDSTPAKKIDPKRVEWRRLIKDYKSTRDQKERIIILKKLRELDPTRYEQAKKIGREMKIKRGLADLEKAHLAVS